MLATFSKTHNANLLVLIISLSILELNDYPHTTDEMLSDEADVYIVLCICRGHGWSSG